MDYLRRFPAPWTVQEGDDQCFRVYDASGYFICSVTHRECRQSPEARGGEADSQGHLPAA
jgi:hypothetical protein